MHIATMKLLDLQAPAKNGDRQRQAARPPCRSQALAHVPENTHPQNRLAHAMEERQSVSPGDGKRQDVQICSSHTHTCKLTSSGYMSKTAQCTMPQQTATSTHTKATPLA
jgi:hypothetical protein